MPRSCFSGFYTSHNFIHYICLYISGVIFCLSPSISFSIDQIGYKASSRAPFGAPISTEISKPRLKARPCRTRRASGYYNLCGGMVAKLNLLPAFPTRQKERGPTWPEICVKRRELRRQSYREGGGAPNIVELFIFPR